MQLCALVFRFGSQNTMVGRLDDLGGGPPSTYQYHPGTKQNHPSTNQYRPILTRSSYLYYFLVQLSLLFFANPMRSFPVSSEKFYSVAREVVMCSVRESGNHGCNMVYKQRKKIPVCEVFQRLRNFGQYNLYNMRLRLKYTSRK